MNTKVKSLFKIACFATAFVIICYLEGKFNIINKISRKSGMAAPNILSAEFEVFGIVQGERKISFELSTLTANVKNIKIYFCRCFLS